ncbi:MAG: Ig-like domain-containing protein [Duncaniella sp.]|nr:Ig-like domain-containing protein [Duncaniella sp.]
MSGSALSSLDIPFNKEEIEAKVDNGLASWKWESSEGTETVTCSWTNSYYARYIHTISVEYTPDLGGKKECGLSFSRKSTDGFLGETFTEPRFSNPNHLEIQWTSSDEGVATVSSNGKVTLVGKGNTTITAFTEGNDDYASGNAKYVLSVIPTASNITELNEYAPSLYDRVKVNFPATVNFGYGSIAFVTDSEGNAACFDDLRNRNSTSTTVITIYKAGDVIPAGWTATNATVYESTIWEGLPEKSTETTEVIYPSVTSITKADADRVVTLLNVKFDTYTASENTKAFGTTPDGTRYEFQDTYDTGSKPAGTYDVTGVVRYSKFGSTEYFYIAPISYAVSGSVSASIIESETGDASYYNLQGIQVAEPNSGTYVKVINGKSVKIQK